MRKYSTIVSTLAVTAIFAACSQPEPIAIQIAPRQMTSGENRELNIDSPNLEMQPIDEVAYEIAGELPPLDESAMSFSFQPRSDNKYALRGLAVGLGVPGDIVKVDKNTLTIGFHKSTGIGIRLWVDASGGWWSYNAVAASTSVSSPECTDITDCAHSITTEPAVKNLLTPAEAIKRASDLLVFARGVPNNYVFSVKQTETTTTVTGHLRFWAMTSNIEVNVVFGENGKVLSAFGPMVSVVPAKTYPLVTPTEGLARLKDPMFAAGGAVRHVASAEPAIELNTTTTVAGRKVSITDVHLTLMQILLANGTYMLLPSYTYFDKNGEVGVVLAVQDKFLVKGLYPTTSIEPVIKMTTTTIAGSSSDGSSGSSGSGSSSSSPNTGETITTVAPLVALTEDNATVLVGHAESVVRRICIQNGWVVRVAERDGELFQLTADYSSSRVNLSITKGMVTAVSIG